MGVTWKAKLIQYQLKLLNCEQSHERNKQYLYPDMNLATFAWNITGKLNWTSRTFLSISEHFGDSIVPLILHFEAFPILNGYLSVA